LGICAGGGRGLASEPQRALQQLAGQLDGAYRQTAEPLDENLALKIAGADRPDLSKVPALDEPRRRPAVGGRPISPRTLSPTPAAMSSVSCESSQNGRTASTSISAPAC
jgi:hypothetical protein